MDKNTLKKYLKRALELEKNKMELEQSLSKINRKYIPKIIETDNTKFVKDNGGAGCLGLIIGGVLGLIWSWRDTGAAGPIKFIFCTAVGYAISWFIVNEINNSEIKQKKLKLAQKNAAIEKQNSQNTLSANKKNKIIALSVSRIKSAITNTQTELDILYASNFIYPKYRNLIAVASMYEYLDSGRCNSLEGADGAYNIYELEVRLDRIITKLDIIISNLEQIRSNQYYLYTAIKEMQPHIDRVTNAIIENTNKLNEVAVNTAVTAYTAQVIERNQYYGRNWNDNRGVYSDRVNMPRMR